MTRLNRPAEILVVDDNRGDAILAARAFKAADLESNLTVADTGEKALAILAREGEYADAPLPDLILLDLNLPKMSGTDVLTQIKADAALRHIPVIILSSSGAERDVTVSYGLHASGYVIKPGSLDQFKRFVSAVTDFFFDMAILGGPDRFAGRQT
ncbi:response regulator [Asticcacaulis sp. BYS171W]|uniref:Response regulator n=1 Tax=Asticcacaulis aquaticus TaxID=2984212 RepID=A0ABT5HYI3_9CAUL|nr:response regulator [Asticcacaulis aquaticus]MDC7685141.1 response regulator [Asticcacaulis aquaticus]